MKVIVFTLQAEPDTDHSRSARSSSSKSYHGGRDCSFVEKHQLGGVKQALLSDPTSARSGPHLSDRNCARLTREEIVTKRVLDLLLTGMVLVILSPSKHFFHVKQRTGHIRCLTAANTIAKYKGVMEGEVISAGLE